MPVEGPDPNTGLAGDLLQRRGDPLGGEGVTSHGDEPFVVAARVGTLGAPCQHPWDRLCAGHWFIALLLALVVIVGPPHRRRTRMLLSSDIEPAGEDREGLRSISVLAGSRAE